MHWIHHLLPAEQVNRVGNPLTPVPLDILWTRPHVQYRLPREQIDGSRTYIITSKSFAPRAAVNPDSVQKGLAIRIG